MHNRAFRGAGFWPAARGARSPRAPASQTFPMISGAGRVESRSFAGRADLRLKWCELNCRLISIIFAGQFFLRAMQFIVLLTSHESMTRKCKVLCYNPPYDLAVKTNIGKKFFRSKLLV